MSQPARALFLIGGATVAMLASFGGCAERMADCVEVYPGTGATRRPGFTMSACQEHCRQVQGTIDCYWDGSVGSIAGPSVIVVTGRDPAAGR